MRMNRDVKFLLLTIALIISSCSSKFSFQKRRYTKGIYFSHAYRNLESKSNPQGSRALQKESAENHLISENESKSSEIKTENNFTLQLVEFSKRKGVFYNNRNEHSHQISAKKMIHEIPLSTKLYKKVQNIKGKKRFPNILSILTFLVCFSMAVLSILTGLFFALFFISPPSSKATPDFRAALLVMVYSIIIAVVLITIGLSALKK